jgi:hypothetical protein
MWPVKYRQFVKKHGLSGVELEVPEGDDLSGIGASIRLYDEDEAKKECEFYPGIVVRADGFVPIGEDSLGSGDPYFVNVKDKQPGPVYRIYHDSVRNSSDRQHPDGGARRGAGPRSALASGASKTDLPDPLSLEKPPWKRRR